MRKCMRLKHRRTIGRILPILLLLAIILTSIPYSSASAFAKDRNECSEVSEKVSNSEDERSGSLAIDHHGANAETIVLSLRVNMEGDKPDFHDSEEDADTSIDTAVTAPGLQTSPHSDPPQTGEQSSIIIEDSETPLASPESSKKWKGFPLWIVIMMSITATCLVFFIIVRCLKKASETTL